ncbi:MAG: hypothetical protein L6V35_04335 [Alistipes putredinis]|nr:MAG: hypothetical protein L6V35_04335 [Alistipes putredinis]
MKKIAIIVFLLFCASGLRAQDPYQKTTLVKTGDRMPAFTVEMLDGKTLASEQTRRQSGADKLLGHVVSVLHTGTEPHQRRRTRAADA